MVRAVAFIAALVFLPAVAAAQQPCTTDARHVVNEIYRLTLERPADRGSDVFVRQLTNGNATVREILGNVVRSPEHMQNFLATGNREANERAVANLYRHILGRQADPDGLRAHAEGVAQSGMNAVIDNMINSTEYQQSFGDYGVPGSPGLRYCGRGESPTSSAGGATRRPGGAINRGVDPGNEDLRDRFTSLDTNRNGRIERNEWDGPRAAFDRLDTNGNNLLSRAEIEGSASASSADFTSLDINRDGRLTIDEWNGNRRSFDSQDANGDGVISAREFTGGPAPTTGR